MSVDVRRHVRRLDVESVLWFMRKGHGDYPDSSITAPRSPLQDLTPLRPKPNLATRTLSIRHGVWANRSGKINFGQVIAIRNGVTHNLSSRRRPIVLLGVLNLNSQKVIRCDWKGRLRESNGNVWNGQKG